MSFKPKQTLKNHKLQPHLSLILVRTANKVFWRTQCTCYFPAGDEFYSIWCLIGDECR